MKTAFRKSFLRDIKRLGKDEKLLGRIIDGDSVTFVRALHRSEIYRHFP